jgi:hypothetical protein
MPEPTTGAAIGGAKVAVDIYKLAKELGWLDKLRTFWKKKKRIVVLGSTGVGKTEFIESLKKLIPDLIANTARTEFSKKTTLALTEGIIIEVEDTPGQRGHESRRRRSIQDAVRRADGVINVVAYGYHEYDIASSQALTKAGEAKETFLRAHRQIEIEQVQEWNRTLSFGVKNPWLITLVSKGDLWWEERQTVKQHYSEGGYFKSLGAAEAMNPTVCLYSSIRHKFFSTAPVSGFFDDDERLRLRADFFRVLFEAFGGV